MEIQQIHSKQTSTKNLSDCQCDAVILAGIVAAIAFIDAEGDTSKIGMITSLLALQPLWPVSSEYEHQTGATRLEESSMMCSETYGFQNRYFYRRTPMPRMRILSPSEQEAFDKPPL